MTQAQEPRHSGTFLYEEKSFLWKVSNYAQLWNLEGEIGTPFSFTMGDKPATEMNPMQSDLLLLGTCKLTVNRPDDAGTKHVVGGLCLHRIPSKLRKAKARLRVEIAGKYMRNLGFEDGILLDLANEHKITIMLPQLVDKPELTADGSLEIRIKITMFVDTDDKNATLAAVEAQFKSKSERTLRDQLTAILENSADLSNNQDIKIVSKDGGQFHANRSILAARSPVLHVMFQSGMREAQAGLVEVKDIDSKPLEVLLHFMRTGELTKNWKDAGVIEGLVCAANKYMLWDLKWFLDNVLGLICTRENCGKLSGLAKTFGMQKAEPQLLKFFKENLANNFEEVAKFTADMEMMTQLMAPQSQIVVDEKEENGEESTQKKPRLN